MTAAAPPGRWAIALAGAVSLAVAMGIGRFAFTPLLPMMLHDGALDLHAASWLASANYLGYLAGALLCTFEPWLRARLPALPPMASASLLRGGLVATGVLTLAMALPSPATWPLLRFASGAASAIVFVHTSAWCLAQLARRDAVALGGVMFAGPGAGIVVTGLAAMAMVQGHWRAASGWVVFGVLAFALMAVVVRVFGATQRGAPAPTPFAAAAPSAPTAPLPAVSSRRGEVACLALAYGLAGLGYIVTATFLPVIAREALPGSPWLDLFWPVFGLGVMVGALLATRLHPALDRRLLLAACYAVQAAGIALTLHWPTLAGFAVGSGLVGLPMTAITFFAMQEVRRLRPALAASTMGLLTAVYGVGQIAGPPLAAALLHRSSSTAQGFALALEVAMAALVTGVLVFLWMARAYIAAPPGRAAA